MHGQIMVGQIELPGVEAGLDDAALEVVGHKGGRGCVHLLEGAHMAADPIGQELAPSRIADSLGLLSYF